MPWPQGCAPTSSTFHQQEEASGVLAQDLDGDLHHLGEGRVRHVVPVQLVLHVPRLEEACGGGGGEASRPAGRTPEDPAVSAGARAPHPQRGGKAEGRQLIWMARGTPSVVWAHHGERSPCPFKEETEAQQVGNGCFQLLSRDLGIKSLHPPPSPKGPGHSTVSLRQDCALDWTGQRGCVFTGQPQARAEVHSALRRQTTGGLGSLSLLLTELTCPVLEARNDPFLVHVTRWHVHRLAF